MARFVVAAFIIVTVIACTGGTSGPEEAPVEGENAEAEVPPTPTIEVKPGFATAGWAIWRAPTDEKKVPNPDGEGTVKNYMLNVERGRPLERIGEQGEWSQVRLEDGTEGWIKSERIVIEDGAKLATATAEARMFKRPELLALVIDKKLPPGQLLITAGTEGKFTVVDYPTGKYETQKMWVLTENLVFDSTEIEAAQVIQRVLKLRESDEAGAADLEDLARGQFPDSKLLPLLEVVEEPPEEGGDEERPAEVRPE